MIHPFEHVSAPTTDVAIGALRPNWEIRVIAGGTDLVTELKAGIVRPTQLVDLKPIGDLRTLSRDVDGTLRIGALVTLSQLASEPEVRQRFPILTQAVEVAATPQLRNVGTIGGNLCQSSRCWYYRGDFACFLRGGDLCSAEVGENPYHAILDGGPCYTVHPSDLATALVALDARVHLRSEGGERTLPLAEFFTRPRPGHWRLNALEPDELVLDVHIPAPDEGARGVYLKAMDRAAWAFALVGVACQATLRGGVFQDVRLVLGGVAPTPWRAHVAEDLLRGQRPDPELFDEAVRAALEPARPLKDNGYKLPLARGLIVRALASVGYPSG